MEELLLKYINGNCTEQEKSEITKWIDSDPKNMKEYLALRKLNDISIWQVNPAAPQKSQTFKPVVSRRIYTEALKIAAVFIFAFLVFKYLIPEPTPQNMVAEMQTIHVPAGQRAELTLQDGTKVWLNASSTFYFPSRFLGNKREVKLEGEGFFDVAHNKEKPFIVNARKYKVKVLGTKFNLIAYAGDQNFNTSLLEGSVELTQQGHEKGIMLSPNEQAFLKNGKMVISAIKNKDHFLWREGIISFDDVTFIELINKLELYFDLTIDVKTPKILDYRYTGKFRMKDGVEHVLKVLKLKNEFDYQIDEKHNRIIIE